MPHAKALDAQQIKQKLNELTGWELVEGELHATFTFADFNEAFGFMARAALVAEQLGHHPAWSNVYNRVEVKLSTHDVGGITELDFQLAAKMNQFAP